MRHDIVRRAVAFAAARHAGQTRKDGKTPYVSHVFRVLYSAATELGVTDPHTLAAAALHDTIEDTTTDFDDLERAFGAVVAGYVALLSKDKRLPEGEREARYFEGLAKAPEAVKLLKIADTLDNLRDAHAAGGAVDEAKFRAKAEKLFEIYGGEPALAGPLGILRAEVERPR
jgi:guanosine-3',5'-bis(diphosphate) 3'-pyrophosphohydrolase